MEQTKKGYVNLHIDLLTGHIYCSQKPYDTEQEAEKGILIGYGIHKIGVFEIEYPKYELEQHNR